MGEFFLMLNALATKCVMQSWCGGEGVSAGVCGWGKRGAWGQRSKVMESGQQGRVL